MAATGERGDPGAAKRDPGFDPERPVGSFVTATRGDLLAPERFFDAVRREDSFAGPVVYAVACKMVATLLAGIYDLGRVAVNGTLGDVSVAGYEGLPGAVLWVLWLLGLSVPYALVLLVVGAGVYQLLLRLVVGRGNAGYGATLRVDGYLSAIALLLWLPALGLLAGVWGVWVNTVGLREVHSTTTARAPTVAAITYVLATGWAVYWVASGHTTLAEFVLGGGTMFPRQP